MFLIDVIIEQDPMQMIDFMLADNGWIMLEPDLVRFTGRVLVFQGNPIMTRYIAGTSRSTERQPSPSVKAPY